jgi:hypothetical protein
MTANRNISIVIILICFMVGFKLLRMVDVYQPSFLWNFHIYVLLIFSVIVFANINKFIKNSLDYQIFIFIFLVFIFTLLRGGSFQAFSLDFVTFILPVMGYYFFRGFNFSYKNIYKIFDALSIFLLILFFLDFFSNNYLNLGLINYDRFHFFAEDITQVSKMNDFKVNYLLDEKILRVVGVTLSPQGSASLYAAFAAYHMLASKSFKGYRHNIIFLMYLIVLLLFNSGTAFFIAVTLFLISKNSVIIKITSFFLIPLFLVLIARYFYGDNMMWMFSAVLSGLYDTYILPLEDVSWLYFKALFFGFGMSESHNELQFDNEINYLDLLFQLGFFNFVIVILILLRTRNIYFKLNKIGINFIPLYYLMLGIIIGSVHYPSIFRYPSSLILFSVIGIASKFWVKEKKKALL